MTNILDTTVTFNNVFILNTRYIKGKTCIIIHYAAPKSQKNIRINSIVLRNLPNYKSKFSLNLVEKEHGLFLWTEHLSQEQISNV